MSTAVSVPPGSPTLPALLDVQTVARLLNCSPRHIYRLADSGDMPRPVKLGALVRWSRQAIEDWVDAGCPRGAGR
jgi:excisionase family DNA binding protein